MIRARVLPLALAFPVLTFCDAMTAAAQTKGRVSAGVSVALNKTTDSDVGTAVSIGPQVRLNPRPGLGFAGAFNWYRADLNHPDGGDSPFARLHVRPLMGGIGYTTGPPRTRVNFSVVAGPSFNKADFEEDFLDATGGSPAIEAKTSFAVRPGVSLTQTLKPRLGFTAFGGYMINRPQIVYRSNTGQEVDDRWKADSLVLSVGLVYSIF